jgi:hypothetical protein
MTVAMAFPGCPSEPRQNEFHDILGHIVEPGRYLTAQNVSLLVRGSGEHLGVAVSMVDCLLIAGSGLCLPLLISQSNHELRLLAGSLNPGICPVTGFFHPRSQILLCLSNDL